MTLFITYRKLSKTAGEVVCGLCHCKVDETQVQAHTKWHSDIDALLKKFGTGA